MAVLWLLGILDLIAMCAMLLLHFEVIPGRIALTAAVYLIAKGIGFRDFASIGDMIVGIYILGMMTFGLESVFVYVFAAFLLQKAVFGFITNQLGSTDFLNATTPRAVIIVANPNNTNKFTYKGITLTPTS